MAAMAAAPGLAAQSCKTCSGGSCERATLLSNEDASKLMQEICPSWTLDLASDSSSCIRRCFVAKNFKTALSAINAFAEVAESEGHHPDFHLTSWRNVEVAIFTHSAGGLTLSDFVLAAKLDRVPVTYSPKFLREHPEVVAGRPGTRFGSISFHTLGSSVAEAALAALPRPIVHLKGFAKRLMLDGASAPDSAISTPDAVRESTERAARALLSLVKDAIGAATIAWDGDDLASDSFTALLPRLVREQPSLRLAAFAHPSRKAAIEASWGEIARVVPLVVFFVELEGEGGVSVVDSKYVRLGVAGMEATRARQVLCFGGGEVTANEHAAMARRHGSAAPSFTLFDVVRWQQSGDTQRSSLSSVKDVAVVDL